VVRVEIDQESGYITVTDIAAIHDVGQVINRTGLEGQIEGGVVMGLGYALSENMVLKQDDRWVDSFSEYLIPTAFDIPEHIETVILEIPEPDGPFGAKGIAEICLVSTAPAIANAVENATGKRFCHLPILPENLVKNTLN
jgi:CO/xanthine dehydrogenase Mo-binding subunit